MARVPKPKPSEPPLPDPEDLGVEETPAQTLNREFGEQREARAVLDIAELIDTISEAEGQVQFLREDPIKQVFNHLERMSIEAVKPDINEFVRTRYGGGRYQCWFYVPKGTGAGYEKMTKRMIDIHPGIPPGSFFKNLEGKDTPDESVMSKILDKIKTEGSGGNTELIVAMMQMQAQQSRDTMNMVMESNKTMMTAMTSMVAALKGGGGGGGRSEIDMLTTLKVFKELSGGGSATDPLKLLEFAHKLSKDMADRNEDEPAWLKALETFLPTLLGNMQQRPGMPVPAQLPANVTATPAPEPIPIKPNPFEQPANVVNIESSAGTSNNQPQEPVSIVFIIKNSLGVIFSKIKQGCSPQDVLDWINNPVMADVFTDDQYDELVEIMKKDDWATVLFGDPKVIEAHKAWFEELRELLLKEDNAAAADQSEQP